ncbi:hypothetical protein FACS1894159_06840 [Bacteroidia bacterium]|nr:hypothetical protein FACS1894159_06840 [Bacteroidia bacterium]
MRRVSGAFAAGMTVWVLSLMSAQTIPAAAGLFCGGVVGCNNSNSNGSTRQFVIGCIYWQDDPLTQNIFYAGAMPKLLWE